PRRRIIGAAARPPPRSAARRWGGHSRLLLEDDLAFPRVHLDPIALSEATLQEGHRKRALDQPLNRALERSGPVHRIPAALCEELPGGVADSQRQFAIRQPRLKTAELDVPDALQLLLGQRTEHHHDLID